MVVLTAIRLSAPRRGHDQDRDMADADDATVLDVRGARCSRRFLPDLRIRGSVLPRPPCSGSDAGRLTAPGLPVPAGCPVGQTDVECSDARRPVIGTAGHRAWSRLEARAVAVGFEPTEELPPHTLSRRAP